ncbi:ATP-binding protein [Actinomadura scrupuli]|uniref:ATP-binding protein n=1 Tax=Actinomadura scrupuli TaxID=559629 RepID=UPI003D98A61C
MLLGREAELSVVDGLLARARVGISGALVVRGEPGIGKTALLDHAAAGAADLRVIRGNGVESEAELPFAGLHLLLRPVLDRLGALPPVQERALRGALGLGPAEDDDRFLAGLAVLSLLSELAGDGPLLCLVDDAHWLDRASAEALIFACRRLDAEGVTVMFAARDGEGAFTAPGLTELRLHGLEAPAAGALLAEHGRELSPDVRRRILAQAAGNPLALLELPGALRGGGVPGVADIGALPLTERMREAFAGQVRRLPAATQTLLLVAAAEETGELHVLLTAGRSFGASLDHLDAAQRAGLIRLDDQTVVFRHPLVRTAVLQSSPLGLRLAVHRALAAALDEEEDADRRAWHLAAGTTGHDEWVAAELERTAIRAGERSGHAAAAAAHERAARLTADPAARSRRLTLAAEAAAESGQLQRSGELAERAARHTTDPVLLARLTQVRATAWFLRGAGGTAHRLLLDGAELVAATDPRRAAVMLIEAVHVGWYIGERELAEAVDRLGSLSLPAEERPAPLARLLSSAVSPIVGRQAGDSAHPDEAVAAARLSSAGAPHDLVLICGLGLILGQDAMTRELAAALAAESRLQGRIGRLPTQLFYLASAQMYLGRHGDARATAAEALTIARDTAQQQWTSRLNETLGYLAAVAGDEQACHRLTEEALRDASVRTPTWGAPWTYWVLGLLDLGLGRAESALSRLEMLAQGRRSFHINATRSTPDLVEAAVRAGRPEAALEPFALYQRWARHAGRPWIDATVHRCRALLAPDGDAEEHYLAARRLVEPENRPFDQARTALLYGEWLRRGRRRSEARTPLRTALETFERLGATPWADRARTELGATGTTTPRQRAPGILARLTPQELQIVRLAAQGLSNRDIAAQLFLSPRTVGHHLYKAYPKLGIASRGELGALALDDPAAGP